MNISGNIAAQAAAYWQRVLRFTPSARLIIFSQTLHQLGFGVYQAIFNLYLLSLGYSKTFVGGFIALGAYTAAFSALAAGPYTQRVGGRNVMVVAGLISSIAAIVQVGYPEPTLLLIMTVIYGIGASLRMTSYSPLMTRSSTSFERTHLFGTSQALRIGAAFIGSTLGGFLPGLFALWFEVPLDSAITFQFALFSWFIPLIFCVFPLLFIREPVKDTNAERTIKSSSVPKLLDNIEHEPKGRISNILKYITVSGLIGLGAGFIIPFMNVFFWEFYNLPTYLVGFILGLGQATVAAGVLLSPILSTRIGKVKTIAFTQALSLPFTVILAILVNPMIAIIAYLFRGVLMNAGMPVNQTFRMELVPSSWRPNMAALNSAALGIGRATSVQISGQLFDQSLYLLPFWMTLICYSSSTLLFSLFFWKSEIRLARELKRTQYDVVDRIEIES